jgi:hypothetical protein
MQIPRLAESLRRIFRGALLMALAGVAAHGADKRVLLIAGPPSHSPGWHEYNAGMLLLQRCLAGTPGLKVDVSLNGWPAAPDAFAGVDAIVLFCDGGPGHPALADDRLKQLEAALARGAGLGLLHYAVEPTRERGEAEFLRWAGGCFEVNWSVNPSWDAAFPNLPDHPILRGVKPFALRDEWYYHLRFAEGMRGVTPLLVAVPPSTSVERPDGLHEGNPAVRAAVARQEPQCLAWAYERPDGGRGFGYTGLHYHTDWANDSVRTLLLNAVLWLAKLEVPAGGVPSHLGEAELWDNLDPKPARTPAMLRGDLTAIQAELQKLDAEIDAAKAAGVDLSGAEISARTVRQFVGWISWDVRHPAELERAAGLAEGADTARFAARRAAQIPSQEAADCAAVLDRARAALARTRDRATASGQAPMLPPYPPIRAGGAWPRQADGAIDPGSADRFYGSVAMQPIALDAYRRAVRDPRALPVAPP